MIMITSFKKFMIMITGNVVIIISPKPGNHDLIIIPLGQWWAKTFALGPLMQKFSFLLAAPLFFGKYKVKKFRSKYIVRDKFPDLSRLHNYNNIVTNLEIM